MRLIQEFQKLEEGKFSRAATIVAGALIGLLGVQGFKNLTKDDPKIIEVTPQEAEELKFHVEQIQRILKKNRQQKSGGLDT